MRRIATFLALAAMSGVVSGAGAAGPRCTLVGTPGPDALFASPGHTVVCGLGGDDKIFGSGGNDVLIGGPGNDYIDGSAGHDVILGGPGNDTIRAFDGMKDVVDGGTGVDSAWTDMVDTVRNVEHRN